MDRGGGLLNRNPDLVREIKERKWFHTIDLGDGLITPGNPPSVALSTAGAIPDVRGRSVLDIGAWDGKYSFEAERAGASRVVALDHYVWRLAPAKMNEYYAQCEAEGRLPDPDLVEGGFLVAEGLPGKRGFDLAAAYLDSEVEAVVGDLLTMDLDDLGQFDVVFYFGVLYHMVNPVAALQRLYRVTGGVAVIETLAVHVPGIEDHSLLEFYPGKEAAADYTNWFAPSEAALHGLCRAVGFTRVETKAKSPMADLSASRRWLNLLRGRSAPPLPYRLVVHAYR
jgi:tRNA (mo5U34)-methyltransferase